MDIFDEWRAGGTEIRWRSTTEANNGAEVAVFTRRCGTPGAPALVCVHGFPTSSIDYFALTRELADEFDIFMLDFPGYGLSDKPPAPYRYSLYDDARLLIHAITNVWSLERYTMLTHDRGSSIGMIALDLLAQAAAPAQLVLTNGNVYLPLSNLTAFQKALLDPATARDTARATTPDMLAAGMGATTFMPRRTLADPEIAALAKCFAHNDGTSVLPDTIQYLHERAADEMNWLAALSRNAVDTSLVWGLHDNVAPVRVANYVWQSVLKDKPGANRYWIVPSADHYVQCDAAPQLAQIIRLTVSGEAIGLQTLGDQPDGAVLADQTSADGAAHPGGDST
ncbi:alpha/beta fold hydrolase [Mycobacterium shimoidei]|uniref:alpha/beta fold hydrolase n=1 Tax=Mycobacterium shimoidei TaxID=29313 RepID=UPI0008486540|nr:alpha/beta fold hydrolase [Mycobacterium shimoidei]MCV7261319.1 alpha/beta fold hydrolase [Mycobacterium shimoidei]ODR07651.1 hydrolase [Mycobacterium shimoidei]ORW83180.1 hydrolase [Mycobacterium shimoidei]